MASNELIIDGLYCCPSCRRPFTTSNDDCEDGLCYSCHTSGAAERLRSAQAKRFRDVFEKLLRCSKSVYPMIPPAGSDDFLRDEITLFAQAIIEAEAVL